MATNKLPYHLLVAVGSRSDQVCSIGSFARAEMQAMSEVIKKVTLLEPTPTGEFPVVENTLSKVDFIMFHAPALYDRKKPWNALKSAYILRKAFPDAKFISSVHEFSEAPFHWKMRQIALLKLSHAALVNTKFDYDSLKFWQGKFIQNDLHIQRSQLGPTLWSQKLFLDSSISAIKREILKEKQKVAQKFSIDQKIKWIAHPGLLTPGKGINVLKKMIPFFPKDFRLLIVGGMGPKKKDVEFAEETLNQLNISTQNRVHFLNSLEDADFRSVLTAADLIVLPYDNGLSERRSSFLSAMSCGANVWTTTSELTKPLELSNSGVFSIAVHKFESTDPDSLESILKAFTESEAQSLERRQRNISWSKNRSWLQRVEHVVSVMSSF